MKELRAIVREANDNATATSVCAGCGAVHSRQSWAELPPAGFLKDGERLLECRRCPCGLPVLAPG